jgi:hypothetical protein
MRKNFMRFFFTMILALATTVGAGNFTERGAGAIDGAARELTRVYGSCPKGVVIEGKVLGIDKIATIHYQSKANQFVLDGEMIYAPPVSRETLFQLAMALARDDRLGVSLSITGSEIIYGALNPQSAAAREMLAADRFLSAIVWGEAIAAALPFAPAAPRNARRYRSVAVHKFFDYRFGKYQNQYYRAQLKMANLVFPLATGADADADKFFAAPETQPVEPTDRDNAQSMQRHATEILALSEVKKVAELGEVAAFLRFLRDDCAVDLTVLGRHIMK